MIKDAESKDLPFPREVLIDAARQFARGVGWEVIAENTGSSAGDLVTFSIDHPEVWGPLAERAEKLRLAEAEGETLAGMTLLLKGDDEAAAENAARELLIHRRHVERRRYGGGEALAETTPGGQKPSFEDIWPSQDPPADITRRITYAANRVAHGGDYITIAGEVGHPREEVARWAFIFAKAWDKAYPTARRTAAQFGASLAINRLLDFVVGPDLKLAARAGRTLLVHRRHMHWSRNRGGEGAGTYPPSVTQGSVAIGGDGSLTVARRSGPARSSGAVRPSADSASVSPVVRARDAP